MKILKKILQKYVGILKGLANQPPSGDIETYKSRPGYYRLRAGKYRIIYHIEQDTILIDDIDSGGQVYK
ncbi:MAG: type II toxin-antitoxin system RelE/ParE family toxin [Defluviitaleaceae bacterium]|nr:type II toxin-antitoxin system RelE/ParE family toxin [Defluviitaleaceae bacterium]